MSENAEVDLRKTVLHPRHLALGGNMAPFGGWDMPLWYRAGAVKEHLAVIQAAGIFDTSHMDVLFVEGGSARDFLNRAFTRDIAGLQPGRVAYGAFLDAEGNCLDDATVYPFPDNRLAVVVNAGMGPVVLRHLQSLPGAEGTTLREPNTRLAKIDVQGPASVGVMRRLLEDADSLFAKFPYFTFKGDFDSARSDVFMAGNTPLLLSRTGYTGELGFELYMPLDKAVGIWDALLREGESEGMLPCGLAARDSLRAGAVLPLSHQDIGHWPFINHPWPFALPLSESEPLTFTKQFVGSDALLAKAASCPHTLAFVGFDPRRVDAHAARVLHDGRDVGEVLTIVSDMAIGRVDGKVRSLASPERPEGWSPRGLACGFVKVAEKLEPGVEIILKDGRREIRAEIVSDIRPARTARKKLQS